MSAYVLTSFQELFEVLIPRNGNVEDLVAALMKKAQLEDESTAGPIRIYEVHHNKVHKDLPREHSVANITDIVTLIAERIPQEELINDRNEYIYAMHYQVEPSKPHGIPFKFHIKPVSPISSDELFMSAYLYLGGEICRYENTSAEADWLEGQEL
jgi:ubiquitin carboxyl-terminal hydrolase 7